MLKDKKFLEEVYRNMVRARAMSVVYEEHRQITKYVHSTSRGHEAIQLALGMQLRPIDWVAPYYRDESVLLGIGMEPYELMLQLLAKADDPFSGGRSYYAHPSLKDEDKPKIPHQSSATGMQAIPTTGIAHGIHYLEGRKKIDGDKPVVVCSLGDGSVTEGEVSEAMQMAVLHNLPILYLVQDNDWGISVSSEEMRAMDAYEFAAGFKGMKRKRCNGADFIKSWEAVEESIAYVREERKPMLLHAKCPLLGHHTSGVRKEFYRTDEDLAKHAKDDPIPIFEKYLLKTGFSKKQLAEIDEEAITYINETFDRAVNAADPEPENLREHIFAPTPVEEEPLELRAPAGARDIIMVDAALYACIEIMAEDENVLLYGQDVGRRLGGVFREAATLAQRYGDDRVFNTPIQEAYIFGSTAGMSAVGLKPIVEVQFCDYIFTGINQLITELSKSCYLSQGKYPVNAILRVPIGAYGGGGPYHSGSHESNIVSTKGIKVVYPSNAADMKGLIKAAYQDPNPVVILEHKGLYWSKVSGTEAAKAKEPHKDYVVPIGKARIFREASRKKIDEGDSILVVTYGMGVHWANNAAMQFDGKVEVLDLRSLTPVDEEMVYERVAVHGKCLVLTEETLYNSFAQSLAGRISEHCFEKLDAPVRTFGAVDLPAVPLNMAQEALMLPSAEKVALQIDELLNF